MNTYYWTIATVLKTNPKWTYGQAAGYIGGKAAADKQDQFAGLCKKEWQIAIDDYAWGYRKGYTDHKAV